jgi:hypothetical protein
VFFLSALKIKAVTELDFWLRIMGDHARLIKTSLRQADSNLVVVAENFREIYDRLVEKVKNDRRDLEFCNEILSTVISFREFKRELLGESLRNNEVTCLSPTVYHHMLNELEEFLKVIHDLQSDNPLYDNIIASHLLWISDAAGHAAMLQSLFDKTEYSYRDEAKAFENAFDKMYLAGVAIAGFFRSDSHTAQPKLDAYTCGNAGLIREFMEFLREIKAQTEQNRLAGNIIPLLPDHMLREERYYLQKIGQPDAETEGVG